MKSKTIKKLVLNKTTITDLEGKMKVLKGGATMLCVELTDFCIPTWGPLSCDQLCYSNNPPAIC